MDFTVPNVGQGEIDAVVDAMKNGHFATGVKVKEFENRFKAMFGYKHVVAVNSGTSALQLALEAMNVGYGDDVLVSAYGIMCTVNAIVTTGARPVFVDIERDSYHMDPVDVFKKVTRQTRACMPTSLFGVPCDLAGIRAALPAKVKIIEDSIECLGSRRNGKAIGMDADAATFGFYPNKQITTGQGGVVVSNDEELITDIRALSQHGYRPGVDLWNPGYGYNMRLPDMLAAMGCVQLDRLSEMQRALCCVKDMLDLHFEQYRRQTMGENDLTTQFVYVIELPLGVNKREFASKMDKQGVPTRPYFNNLAHASSLSPQYRGECPVSMEVGSRTIALPFHHKLTVEDVQLIADAFERSI